MGNEYAIVHDDNWIQCIHHWLIDAVNLGVCKKCGESKQFCSTWSAASIQNTWRRKSGKVQDDVAGTKS
jgi:hypothetical protein